MPIPDINMIMLGPSRVGKSSLLATMYRQIDKLNADFTISPVGETHDRLDEAYFNLSRVMNQPKFTSVQDLLTGTLDFIEHRFELTFWQRPECNLVFHDFRGGAMMKTSDQDYKTLQRLVEKSHVIFNVLDAVSLMEVDEVLGDERNGHDRTRKILERALRRDGKYLILFVLVKCESYLKKKYNERRSLIERFEERHASVLQLVDKLNREHNNVVAVLIPVITLGCVEFHKLDSDKNYVFITTRRSFEPKDVDQPLRYALSFALRSVDDNRPIWTRIWRWLTGRDKLFRKALMDFCEERKRDYIIYGNRDLLG